MVFGWIRALRRRRLLQQPFPDSWKEILRNNARFVNGLDAASAQRLQRSIRILVAEKHWEGCGGLRIDDEHRVTIAAQIARMTLGFNNEYFPETQSILLYPDAYVATSQEQMGAGIVVESQSGRLGEAWYRGPVILSWQDVLATGRRQNFARNVVVHEFAHQLDMRNGRHPDGIPVIESAPFAELWQSTIAVELENLRTLCRQGVPNVLDCYGATSEAELFAVATEVYFEEPAELQREWPSLYRILSQFYTQRTPTN